MRGLVFLVSALGLSPLARAADEGGADLVPALQAELVRQQSGLSLPGAPPIYHLRAMMQLFDTSTATASYGALVAENQGVNNALSVEVRLSSAAYDNTGFEGWQNGFERGSLPEVPTPRTVHQALWRLSDSAYKASVEQFARKRAAIPPSADAAGDFLLRAPTRASSGSVPLVGGDRLADLARQVSSAFPPATGFLGAAVHTAAEAGVTWVVDTEGTQVQLPHQEVVVAATARTRAPDGLLLTDHRLWIARTLDQLPSIPVLSAQTAAMAADLARYSAAPLLDDEYVGPVLFEDAAAVDLFRYLLIPQLEGTPPVARGGDDGGFLGSIGLVASGSGLTQSDTGNVRLGRRVLPPGWSVSDDPRRDADNAASFAYDAEGTPAQAVTLVRGGIVQSLLMSRIPRKDLAETNGHARGSAGDRLAGRAAMMEVVPERSLSSNKLRRKALAAAAEYGRDWVVVVRKLQDPAARSNAGGSWLPDDTTPPPLPPPVAVFILHADGSEEPVRGADFAGVERFVLRDLLAAGPSEEANFYAAFEPGGIRSSVTDGMPTWMRAPEVLVGEMELVPMSPKATEKLVIPAPAP